MLSDDLQFTAEDYAVVLEGGRRALNDILPDAMAHLWIEQCRTQKSEAREE